MILTRFMCCQTPADTNYNELTVLGANDEYSYEEISVTDSNCSADVDSPSKLAPKLDMLLSSPPRKKWSTILAAPPAFLPNPGTVSSNDSSGDADRHQEDEAGKKESTECIGADRKNSNIGSNAGNATAASDGKAVDQDYVRKSLQRRAASNFQKDVFHAGTFEMMKFKANVFQRARIMLDLEKNPPKLDNNGQPFKVNMDKNNILDSSTSVTDLSTKGKCCMYRMSFLKMNWLAICLDPESLNGQTESDMVKNGRHSRLARELKCQNPTDVINAAFCIHLCTFRGFKFRGQVCFIQHLLNKRLYACAAISHELPEGRSSEKINAFSDQRKAPWFDMESDVIELSIRVRSRHEAALTLYMQNANTRAPKGNAIVPLLENPKPVKGFLGAEKSAANVDTAPWSKPAALAKATVKSKAKAKSRIGAGSVGFNAD
eukprot:GEMP01025326.1.p1 GENE.GEMP01025326.1~~GEMP01025326.1.p1  ORF type:complete len:432 (+),score=74.44 GEMP01025326.1:110-1405(+)